MTDVQLLMLELTASLGASKRHRLEAAIDARSSAWMRLRDCWIVLSDNSAEAWTDALRHHLSDRDRLLVLEVRVEDAQGLLSKGDWEWVKGQLDV